MSKSVFQSSQSLRCHAFIHRTQTTSISVVNRKWEDVDKTIRSGLNLKKSDESKIKALRIDECNYEKMRQNQYPSQIMNDVIVNVFSGLTKITVTKCQLPNINFYGKGDIFSNLEELDLNTNNLIIFP